MEILTTEAKVKLNDYKDEFLAVFPNTSETNGEPTYTDSE